MLRRHGIRTGSPGELGDEVVGTTQARGEDVQEVLEELDLQGRALGGDAVEVGEGEAEALDVAFGPDVGGAGAAIDGGDFAEDAASLEYGKSLHLVGSAAEH